MDAKKYLGQLKLLDARINNSRQELASLRRMLQDMQGVDYSAPKVQVSHAGSAMEKNMARYLQLEQEVGDNVKKLSVLRHDITRQINSLDNAVFVRLLFLRYVEYMDLPEVADVMGYSYQHARRLHGYALQSFTDYNREVLQKMKSGY